MEQPPFRTLQNVYLTGNTYQHDSHIEEPEFRPLIEAYRDVHITEAVSTSPLAPEAITAIAGVDADLVLNYYRTIDMNFVLNNVSTAIGSPTYRAIEKDLHGKPYKDLSKLVSSQIGKYPGKPLIITTASRIRKLRSPFGGRICGWDSLEGMEDVLANPYDTPIQDVKKGQLNLLRCLAIIHLVHEYSDGIVQMNKVPAGISYEAHQIEQFDENLEGLPPLPIILPGSRDLYLDKAGQLVLIDGAANVKGQPKADLALTNGDEQVFWISFKHGKYVEDANKPGEIPFQQWGSHMGIYEQEEFTPLLDKYLTGVAESLGQHYTREQVEQMAPGIDELTSTDEGSVEFVLQNVYKDHFSKKTKTGALDRSSSLNKHEIDDIHVFSSGTPEIVNMLFDSNKQPVGSKIELLALKAIYGDSYSPGNKKMGINNVNILLQTPESAKFEVVTGTPDDPDEIWAVEMKMQEDSHIIKNPDLPNSIPYLPCLYTRYTYASPIVFNNRKTRKKEAIVGGRVLLYPQGKVSKNATIIDAIA